MPPLDIPDLDFPALLRSELDAFATLLDEVTEADMDRVVPSCSLWDFYRLTDHLGNGNRWVTTAVREGHGFNNQELTAPRDPASLAAWFQSTAEEMAAALDVPPQTEAWTFTDLMPRTVGFWHRRRAHETRMHRWDAQNVLGAPDPFQADLAADAVTEVFELLAKGMVARGAAANPDVAVKVSAVDVGRSWTYGPGEPVAEVCATASDLALRVWNRIGADAPGLEWTGDRAAGERILAGPLVP